MTFFSNTVRMRPATYYVLVVLLRGSAHGYGIRAQIRGLTDGYVDLRPSTLYGTLGRLDSEGLISKQDLASAAGPARQNYQITPRGRATLRDEADRLACALEAWRRASA